MISILFLAADPTDLSRLRISLEFREIQERLQLSKHRFSFELTPRMSVRAEDLSQALLDINPQVVHFSGHGAPDGALLVEDKMGGVNRIKPEALSAIFELFSGQVKCVILNSCYSEMQAVAIAKHIDYVIGMSDSIEDEAAIKFSVGFYQALGADRSVEDAYKFGCAQMRPLDSQAYLTPVLITKKIEEQLISSKITEKTIIEVPSSISPHASLQVESPEMVEFVLRMRETNKHFIVRSQKTIEISRIATYLAATLLPHMMNQRYEWSLEFDDKELPGHHTLLTAGISDKDELFLVGNHSRPKVRPYTDVS